MYTKSCSLILKFYINSLQSKSQKSISERNKKKAEKDGKEFLV